ncbi:YdeI/OmpD-associated family protein [Allomuricauda sp. SCSIO 65647]|uniref:YdeI/OmpD-associated family protein n=1 Tax=Allomuricauda sp. SCSIO 65647 TaxID=2908843 RepID=UPI001F44B6E5|nr:YdeI/OmpD-associated family protein [Muricauda sp. SCSIO 65647]UJH67746.1 YdeI/OmpD-associated family protein [Muricauda sp. SCSIO 65647]
MESPVFEATVSGMHSLIIPEQIARPFIDNGHKRVKVVASFEGKSLTFHAALNKYQGNHVIMFSKNNQKTLGIFLNDYFQLQFFEDTSKYGVEVPEELEAVLMDDQAAFQIFESFTKGKQRGIIYAIGRYKNSQTRIDKSLVLCENLKRGIRDNKELLRHFS